jgi:hypothetical protein
MLADFIHGNDTLARDRSHRSGFAREPLPRRSDVGQGRIENFDRHVAMQGRIECTQHDARGPATNRGKDVVRANSPGDLGIVRRRQ